MFKIQKYVHNNICFAEEYLGYTPIEVQGALGLTHKEYENLIKGNLKLSTKQMWKIVKLFKVPLEYLVNLECI